MKTSSSNVKQMGKINSNFKCESKNILKNKLYNNNNNNNNNDERQREKKTSKKSSPSPRIYLQRSYKLWGLYHCYLRTVNVSKAA